jgi:hypothetical protein
MKELKKPEDYRWKETKDLILEAERKEMEAYSKDNERSYNRGELMIEAATLRNQANMLEIKLTVGYFFRKAATHIGIL